MNKKCLICKKNNVLLSTAQLVDKLVSFVLLFDFMFLIFYWIGFKIIVFGN